jgi:hypothetical protein
LHGIFCAERYRMTKPIRKEPTPNFDGWKRITIEKARELTKTPGILIWIRPEKDLPEEQQYALIRG